MIFATAGAQPPPETETQSEAQLSLKARPFFDAVPFAGSSPDSARLDIYLVVPYAAVSFERTNGVYAGRYQARIRVERNGRSIYDSSFIRTLRTPSYDATVGRAPGYEFFQRRVELPAGEYTARVDLVDLRTSRTTTLSLNVTAPADSGARLAMSGLLLVKKIREEGNGYVITPMISEAVAPDEDGYFLFFETYNPAPAGIRVRITGTHTDAADLPVGDRVSSDRTIPTGRSQQWVRMTTAGMPRGTFTARLTLDSPGDTLLQYAQARRTIQIGGGRGDIALGEEELREKIAQLRYVAAQSEIDHIRDGATLAERQQRYGEFWEKLDPIPETAVNEAMEQYFHRVEYAESHYRSYAAGWLTDKGRVYITFGPPDNSSTDPFRTDGRSVEVWQYYRRNLRLTFIDETGFGDYRLATPISPGEKFRYDGP